MPSTLKFPPTVEIKRVIAAEERAGIEIGSIEIQPRKITIHPKEENEDPNTEYDRWKMREGQDTERVRRTDSESDALPRKPTG
jgi:hypothetical protein